MLSIKVLQISGLSIEPILCNLLISFLVAQSEICRNGPIGTIESAEPIEGIRPTNMFKNQAEQCSRSTRNGPAILLKSGIPMGSTGLVWGPGLLYLDMNKYFGWILKNSAGSTGWFLSYELMCLDIN